MRGSLWTCARVFDRLVVFFRRVPNAPILAVDGKLLPTDKIRIDGLDVVLAVLEALGPQSEAAHRFLVLAKMRASQPDRNVSELCKSMGWSRATIYRHCGQ